MGVKAHHKTNTMKNERNIWRTHTNTIIKCMESCTSQKQFLGIIRMISNSWGIMINSGTPVEDANLWQKGMLSKMNEYNRPY